MTSFNYKHPPITEAVIAISFEAPISEPTISKLQSKYQANYPHHQDIENLNVKVAMDVGIDKKRKTTTNVDEELGHRLTTPDMTELLVVFPQSFMVSQLAPYPGWDVFFARFDRDWKIWKRLVGFRQVKQIAIRYINRVDIPIVSPIVDQDKYLNVYPQVPELLGPTAHYGIQSVFPLSDIGCTLVLNSAVVPSPLLGFASFLIDLNISKSTDSPQNDDDIFSMLNEMRIRKNAIFEACITDRARELFNHD